MALFAAALAVRLFWGLGFGAEPDVASFGDSFWYHATARLLAEGRGYVNPFSGHPTAAWPPGYPALLSVVYRLAGPTPAGAWLLNAVAGTVTCAATFLLGTRMGSRRHGLIAMALLAFWPSHVLFTSLVLSEVVSGALLAVLIASAALLLQLPSTTSAARAVLWILWGRLLGCATLVRSESLVASVAPPLVVATVAGWRSAARLMVLVTLGASLTLTPWIVRNAYVFGAFVPVTTSLGRTLWVGHNPGATGRYNPELHAALISLSTSVTEAKGPAAELATSKALTREALAFARNAPARELRLLFLRGYHVLRHDHSWSPWYDDATTAPLTRRAQNVLIRVSDWYYALVLAAAAWGWFRSGGSSTASVRRLAGTTILLWLASFSLLQGDARYHMPLLPLLCVLAAHGLIGIAERSISTT